MSENKGLPPHQATECEFAEGPLTKETADLFQKILLLQPRTCDGCRHWNHEPTDPSGFCEKAVGADYAEESKSLIHGEYSRRGDPPKVWTGPKFGCIHWQQKETLDAPNG